MTQRFFLLLLMLCCCEICNAQEVTTVTIKAGTRPNEVLSNTDIFYYPQFTKGLVSLKDGTIATAFLNYNRLLDEMQFIDKKGDTLSLANELTIRFVAVGADTFYFANGFVRQVNGDAKVRLAIKQFWIVADNRKQGGYNTMSSLAASVPKGSFTAGNRMYQLNSSTEIVLEKAELYYFANRNNRFLIAGKKKVLSLFPKAEKQITAFLNENKINFRKKEDVEKLLAFLQTLD